MSKQMREDSSQSMGEYGSNSLGTFKKKDITTKEYLKTVSCCLNPKDPGGEQVYLEVDIYDNGDDKDNIFTNAHLRVQSYGTHTAQISLYGPGFYSLKEACDLIGHHIKNNYHK